MDIQVGIVQSMDGTRATVVPNEHPGIVTQPLVVPFYWRATMGNLQPGDEVYFLEDDAHGGYIIGRTDGEWDNTLRGKLTVTEDISTGGGVTASGDVNGQGVSLASHTHTDSMGGGTSKPN